MVINVSKKHQFATRVYLENQLLEIVPETKLLGCIITSDLKFEKNTEYIIKKAYTRMSILHRLYSFNLPVDDLVHIYMMYIRSLLEQNVALMKITWIIQKPWRKQTYNLWRKEEKFSVCDLLKVVSRIQKLHTCFHWMKILTLSWGFQRSMQRSLLVLTDWDSRLFLPFRECWMKKISQRKRTSTDLAETYLV